MVGELHAREYRFAWENFVVGVHRKPKARPQCDRRWKKVVQLKISLRSLDWVFRHRRVIKILVWLSSVYGSGGDRILFRFLFSRFGSVVIKAADSQRTAEFQVCQDVCRPRILCKIVSIFAPVARPIPLISDDLERLALDGVEMTCRKSIERFFDREHREKVSKSIPEINRQQRHEQTEKITMTSKQALLSSLSIHESSDNAFQFKLFSDWNVECLESSKFFLQWCRLCKFFDHQNTENLILIIYERLWRHSPVPMESPHQKKTCASSLKYVIWFFISRTALEFNVSSSHSKSFPSASIREVTKASSGRKAVRTHVLSIKQYLGNYFPLLSEFLSSASWEV